MESTSQTVTLAAYRRLEKRLKTLRQVSLTDPCPSEVDFVVEE